MKSKILLALLVCCAISGGVSAQCYAYFTYQQNPVNTSVTFYVDSISGSAANNIYSWSFGDGTAGTGSQLVHTYNSLFNTYTVCLTMTDTVSHCTSTSCDTVQVGSGPTNTCGAQINFTRVDSTFAFSATGSGTPPYAYSWTVDGQPNATTTANMTTVLHDSVGYRSHVICVSITDSTGCVASNCSYVYDSAIAQCTTYASVSNQDSTYTFTASHIGGNALTYSWTYNNTSLGTTPSITTVLNPAALVLGATICVTISDDNGCSSTDCITLSNSATGGGCQAYFVITPDTINSPTGSYVGYNYSSGGFGSNVLWDFGDGSTSNTSYPTHVYATPGQYTICLTVGVAGTTCYDTYCDSSFYAFKTAGGLMSQLTITSPTTGINETKANAAFSIYPNPVSDKLTITTAMTIDNEKIYNMSGQLMFERKSGNEINVAKLSAGVYVLELSSGGAVSRTKFVKN